MSDLFAAIDATWPAAETTQAGGFTIRRGLGGGSRVSCATRTDAEAPDAAEIDAAIAVHERWDQPAIFQIRPGQGALDAALAARGMQAFDVTAGYEIALDALTLEPPPLSGFAHWPPLAITRELLAMGDIGPARQAVMERACAPRCTVLGRLKNRPAGACFAAIHETTVMLHGLTVSPEFRRQGLAVAMIAELVRWARAEGAERLSLVVRPENTGAVALYEGLGMVETARYHYRREAR